MYALYKQALQDPPIEKAEQPGTFDLKGKAKKRAWQVGTRAYKHVKVYYIRSG